MKRFIVATLLLILVVAICGGLIWFNFFREQMIGQFFATMKQPAVTISAIEVEPVTWTPGIEAVGTVAASQGVDVAVQAGGIVKEILFKANDKVKAGQVLVQIDDSVDRAGLASAKTSVAVAQDALTRAQTLLDRKVGTTATLQDAQNNLDKAKGALGQIEATLDQKAIDAPFDGTIGIPQIDLGQYVQPATVVATLQNLDTMKVNFTIPEQQLPEIQIGQTVKFGLTADKLNFTGKLSGIDPKIDADSRLVSVQAVIDNADGTLRPGQFIHVRVDLPPETGVVALPQTAVILSLYGSYVYAVEDAPPAPAAPAAAAEGGAAAQTPAAPAAPAGPSLVVRQIFVDAGRRSGNTIEILKGVDPGMKIVTSGQNKLSPGSPVVVDNSAEPTPIATSAKD